ncbi:hypothetical protein [Echinicola sp. 20G]|uniref:HYC_CC_PP family protein n=1 Tax=Echinicola sp. 20G TaxID=2781961 RepID=UPI0019105741|nr:hypothetical protein [Echinicola sp. 20G]
MRKLIQISLLIIYLCFNAGLSYSMHYCGDTLERINLFAEEKTCCENEKEMPGCCDDVPKTDLQNTDQSNAKPLGFDFFNITALPVPHLLSEILVCISQQGYQLPTTFVPDKVLSSTIPIHIQFQRFLI